MRWAVCSEIGVLRSGTKDATFGTIYGTFGTKIGTFRTTRRYFRNKRWNCQKSTSDGTFGTQNGTFGTKTSTFGTSGGTVTVFLEQKWYFRNINILQMTLDGTLGTKTSTFGTLSVLSEHQRFANDIRRYFIHILGSASAFGQINTSCQFFGL